MSQITIQQVLTSLVNLNNNIVGSTNSNLSGIQSLSTSLSSMSNKVSQLETALTSIDNVNNATELMSKMNEISSFVSGKLNEFDNEAMTQLSSNLNEEVSGLQEQIDNVEISLLNIQDSIDENANSLSGVKQIISSKMCAYEYANITKLDNGSYAFGTSDVLENRIPNSGTIYLSEGANGKLLAFAAISAQLKLLNDDTDIRALVEDVNGNIQSISDLTNTISGIQSALDSLESITTQNIENSSGYVNENVNQSSSTNVELEKYVLTGVAPSITINCKNGQFIDIDASRSVYAKVVLSSNNNPYALNLRILDGDGASYKLNNKNFISYDNLSAGAEYVYRITSFGSEDSYVENISKSLIYDSVFLLNNELTLVSVYDTTESCYISSLNLSSKFGYDEEEYVFDWVSSNVLTWNIASSSIDNIDDMMYISGNELIFNNPSGLPSTEFTVFFEAAVSGKESMILPSYGELTFNLSSVINQNVIDNQDINTSKTYYYTVVSSSFPQYAGDYYLLSGEHETLSAVYKHDSTIDTYNDTYIFNYNFGNENLWVIGNEVSNDGADYSLSGESIIGTFDNGFIISAYAGNQ